MQPQQPSSSQPSKPQPKQQAQAQTVAKKAGLGLPDSAPDNTAAPDAAAAKPPAAVAANGPGSAAADASPAKKRGAPRKRRVLVVPKDEGDVEGFDFAVPLQRKQPPAPAAEAADLTAAAGPVSEPAASEPAAAAAGALEPVVDVSGMSSPKREADGSAAAEAGTPFGSPAAQQQVQPEQQQQQQQSARQPAAAQAEVRDTDDWGIDIVDLAPDAAAAPAEPDSGGRVAAAAVAEATNNARGGAGTQ